MTQCVRSLTPSTWTYTIHSERQNSNVTLNVKLCSDFTTQLHRTTARGVHVQSRVASLVERLKIPYEKNDENIYYEAKKRDLKRRPIGVMKD